MIPEKIIIEYFFKNIEAISTKSNVDVYVDFICEKFNITYDNFMRQIDLYKVENNLQMIDIDEFKDIVFKKIDLFENYQYIPDSLSEIVDKFVQIENTIGLAYEDCKTFLKECESLDYTFDYGLDAQPYNLRPKNISEQVKFWENIDNNISTQINHNDISFESHQIPRNENITISHIDYLLEELPKKDFLVMLEEFKVNDEIYNIFLEVFKNDNIQNFRNFPSEQSELEIRFNFEKRNFVNAINKNENNKELFLSSAFEYLESAKTKSNDNSIIR